MWVKPGLPLPMDQSIYQQEFIDPTGSRFQNQHTAPGRLGFLFTSRLGKRSVLKFLTLLLHKCHIGHSQLVHSSNDIMYGITSERLPFPCIPSQRKKLRVCPFIQAFKQCTFLHEHLHQYLIKRNINGILT